ncbi:MAG: sensor histidine kinase [Deltaproteobacteria bacterium]|nr:MAG: sensor histidine kinase [Deltaproteobacteria bacterium]
MKSTHSLRGRLFWAFVGVVVPAVTILLVAVHLLVAHRLENDLLERTNAVGRLVAGLVEFDPHDGVELEGDAAVVGILSAAPEPTFVWVDVAGRTVVAPPSSSRSGVRTPPRPDCLDARKASAATSLLDERTLFASWCGTVTFEEAAARGDAPVAATVAVARDGVPLRRTILAIDGILLLAGLGALSAGAVAAAWATRRGLSPLDELGAAIENLERHGQRIDVALARSLPRELRPVVAALDHTLERLAEAYERERASTHRIAHELRTPLASMRTQLEVLSARCAPDTPIPSNRLLDLLDDVDAMGRTVEVLLSARRARTSTAQGRRTPVDLARIVAEVLSIHESEASVQGRSFDVRSAPTPVLADPTRLRIVVGNLVSNAIRHGLPGSPIRVEVGRVGDTVVRIENRYEGPRRRPGTGLGLAIARDVAAGDGMRIDVAFEDGRAVARLCTDAPPAPDA